MRYGLKHKEWIGYLSKEEFDAYQEHVRLRRWCFERMKDHENAMARLEIKGRGRRTAVREAAE